MSPRDNLHGLVACFRERDTPSAGESISDDDKYYFGFDIRTYWFGPLGRVFGLAEDAIERRAWNALRQRMGWQGSGRHQDARHVRNIFQDRET